MPNFLRDKHVVLGVTGSIACHKAVDLASKLTQAGALVDVVMTRGASNFVTPLIFQNITHRPVSSIVFDAGMEAGINHVNIAEKADLIVVAPATANTIAKIAMGLADDSLTTMVLATRAPIIICPAMDGHMYANIITQANIERLVSVGHTIAGPSSGYLASGLNGDGRLLETNEIMNHIFKVLGRTGDLADKKVVVSAGGTKEFIDPVRFIGNRSSGKMGYAIAEAARDRGAMTVLVAAPTNLPNPVGVQVLSASTALQMKDILATECEDADVLVMAAAVADWRPVKEHKQKLSKGGSDSWNLALTKTPDILADIQREGLIKVGFAAEDSDLENKARAKLEKKGLHLIAANDFTFEGAGFEVDTNRVLLLDYEGHIEELDLMSKYQVGHRIFDKVSTMFGQD